jgi:hypothetical protein
VTGFVKGVGEVDGTDGDLCEILSNSHLFYEFKHFVIGFFKRF